MEDDSSSLPSISSILVGNVDSSFNFIVSSCEPIEPSSSIITLSWTREGSIGSQDETVK